MPFQDTAYHWLAIAHNMAAAAQSEHISVMGSATERQTRSLQAELFDMSCMWLQGAGKVALRSEGPPLA